MPSPPIEMEDEMKKLLLLVVLLMLAGCAYQHPVDQCVAGWEECSDLTDRAIAGWEECIIQRDSCAEQLGLCHNDLEYWIREAKDQHIRFLCMYYDEYDCRECVDAYDWESIETDAEGAAVFVECTKQTMPDYLWSSWSNWYN
jgi:hypothetical protein